LEVSPNKDRLMNGLIEYIKSISFNVRWMFMSPKERYAHLWAKTKKLNDLGYTVLDTAAGTDK